MKPSILSFIYLLITTGCGPVPTHASYILTPEYTPTDSPTETEAIVFESGYWTSHVLADTALLQADTTLDLVVEELHSGDIEGFLRHREGTLVADGIEIPPDTWLLLYGYLDMNEMEMVLEVDEFGHSLTLDVDVDPTAEALEGYFTVDEIYDIWVFFR